MQATNRSGVDQIRALAHLIIFFCQCWQFFNVLQWKDGPTSCIMWVISCLRNVCLCSPVYLSQLPSSVRNYKLVHSVLWIRTPEYLTRNLSYRIHTPSISLKCVAQLTVSMALDEFLYFHYLSSSPCIDIIRRNYILIIAIENQNECKKH